MFTRITRLNAINAFVMAGGSPDSPIPLIDLISELQLTGVPLTEVLVGIAEQLQSEVFEVSGTTVNVGPNYC
jgi:hypothetical protein